jgi:hypothetical protein
METKERLIEVRTADGKPILNLRLIDREVIPDNRQDVPSAQNTPAKDRTSQPGSTSTNESSMTDAQKRYLFRILAEKGMEADKAHQHLKELFGVDSLQEVTKAEASRMIERLLEEAESK